MLMNSVFARYETPILEAGVDREALKDVKSGTTWKMNNTSPPKFFILIKEENGAFRLVKIDHYLGHGNFGTVYKVTSIFDNTNLALKVSMTPEKELKNDSLNYELRIYQKLYPQQPLGAHITGIQRNCLQMLLNLPKLPYPWEMHSYSKDNYCKGLLMPYYPQTLNFININPSADHSLTNIRITYIYQLLLGQAYLESKKMAHFDVAPRNCLLDALQIDLSDFGGILDFSGTIKSFYLPFLMYPEEATEISKDSGKYIPKIATFQIAVLIYKLIKEADCSPFQFTHQEQPISNTLKNDLGKQYDWLFEMLDLNVEKRPTPKEALFKFHRHILDINGGKKSPEYERFDPEVQALDVIEV